MRDINANGSIDSGLELFGVDTDITVNNVTRKATNGFEALAALDANGDKIFNATDAAFTQVRLWQDLNQNGVSDAGELSTLADKGITSIALNFTSTNTNLGNGNTVTGKAVVTRTNGTSEIDSVSVAADSAAYNLNLADNPFYSQLPAVQLTSTATALPEMHGSGSVHGLREAMSLGTTQATTLTNTVTQFAAATTRDAQMALLDQLVQQWGATSSLTTSSPFVPGAPDEFTLVNPSDPLGLRIQTFARANPALYHKIIALEQFNGQTGLTQLITRWGTSLPSGVTSSLESAYAALRESTYGALALQTRLRPYFDAITLTVSDSEVGFDTSGLQSKLEALHSLNAKVAIADLVDLEKFGSPTLNAVGFDGLGTLSTWFSAYSTDVTASAYLTGLGIALARSNVGTETSDFYVGDAGSGKYSARNGDDICFGGAGNDWLDGEAGNDELIGGTGNDALFGESGADTLDGGAGNDVLNGGDGADTYLFYKGAGQDGIYTKGADSTEANPDCILLGPGITTSSVTLAREYDNLVIRLNDSDDELVVHDYFYNDGAWYGATLIKFEDGTIWDLNTVKPKVSLPTSGRDILHGYANNNDTINGGDGDDDIYGYAGNDVLDGSTGSDDIRGGDGNDSINGGTNDDELYGGSGNDILLGDAHNDNLYGDAGNDTLDGGTGNDALDGGSGADTYLFGIGSGQDTLSNADSDKIGTNADCILLGTGITSTDVALVRQSDDLIIKLNGRDDTLRVRRFFENEGTTSWAVENLKFADGTTWDINTVKAKAIVSTSGNDILYGYATNDAINGGDGNDVIEGLTGDDILDGSTGADSIKGGEGNDTAQGGAGNDTLYGGNGDDSLLGNEQADALYGDAGNDTLNGGTGNDYLSGGIGSDTYVFGKGGGRDTIDNTDADAVGTNADSILLGAGIATSGVTLARQSNDLVVNLNGSVDTLRVLSYFDTDGSSSSVVENLKFADGTVWDVSTVKAKILTTTASNDTLIGYATNDTINGGDGHDVINGNGGADVLNGNAGDDRLSGGDGADLYLFGKGSGQDTIYNADSDGVGINIDTISLGSGIATSDVTLRRDGNTNDLIISLNNSSDTLRVLSYLYADATTNSAVENLKFADGTIWDIDTVKKKTLSPTTGNDSLRGYATNDTINSDDGNDTVLGYDGDDVLDGGSGADSIEGDAGNDTVNGGTGADTLFGGYDNGNDSLHGNEHNDQLYGQGGNDTLDGGSGSDYLDGGPGADVYLFGKGSGQDTVSNYDWDAVGTNADTILLGTGITTTGVTLVRQLNDLIIGLSGSNDTLRVQRYFDTDGASSYVVENLRFSDGTTWNYAAVKSRLSTLPTPANILVNGTPTNENLVGGLGNDSVYGQAGNDTLDGGFGNDSLDGGAGNDTYLFGKGSGEDTIRAYDSTASKLDLIQLGSSVLTTDVVLKRESDSLVLAFNDTVDTLRISDYLIGDAASGYQVEQIKFADGTIWDVNTVKQILLTGANGNDAVYGYESNDTLEGGAGADTLFGKNGNDSLLGGEQNDSLIGGEGNDTLNGGSGSDTLEGGVGNDTYLFGKGSGKDIISSTDNTVGKVDVIQLGSGVLATDVVLRRESDTLALYLGTPALYLNSTEDTLRVSNYFKGDATNGNQVELIKFADGTIWDINTVKARMLTATSTNDRLIGYATADTLDGGLGNDVLSGGAGADTYLFGIGGGQDTIFNADSDSIGTNADCILLGNGIASTDITLVRQSVDLLLRVNGRDDALIVASYFESDGASSYAVENIKFADGTNWDINTVKARVLASTTGNDTLYGYATNDAIDSGDGNDVIDGYAGDDALNGGTGADSIQGGNGNDSIKGGTNEDTLYGGYGNDSICGDEHNDTLYGDAGNDTLDGGAGNDSLSGDTGADTYLFGIGAGQDTISNSDNDAVGTNADCILLGAGVTSTNVVFVRQSDDLIIKLNGRDDTLLVQSYFKFDGSSNNVVENIKFADGTTWDINAVKARALVSTSGNDMLSGYATNDAINGGDGNDTIDGLLGDDVLDGGAGADSIQGGNGNDNIKGGTGWDIIFGGDGNDSLFGNEHDDRLYGDAGDDIILGQEGNDDLIGRSGNDTLDGGTGNDTLDGETGNDTYLFGKGSGKDTLFAYDLTVGKLDVIQFGSDVLTTDVTLKRERYINREKDDLAIFINGTTDKLLVRDYFIGDATSGRQVEQIKFADGTIWDINTVKAKVLAASSENDLLFGYDTADYISGQAGEDILNGEGGDDTMIGGSQDDDLDGGFGNDTYIFGRGDGQDVISDRDYTEGNTDTLQFSAGIASSDVRAIRDVNDLLLTVKGSYDQVTVHQFFDGTNSSQIERFTFADHTAWTVTTINDLVGALEQNGTASGDTLTGSANVDLINASSGNDSLTALAGNDFLFAGEGNDTLDGGADNDWLWGEGGNDKLDGGTGADTMLGGLGDDTYYIDNIGDLVIESANAGRDTVRTTVNYTAADNVEVVFASGTDNINLTANKTTGTQLSGNAGTNVLTGGSGADRLYSRGGADTMQGGDGNDAYFVDSADARIIETATGGTVDAAYVYIDNFVAPNYVEQITLASSAAVSCYGSAYKSTIRGNSQNNYLDGAGGLDFLEGGDGNDTLRGGTATDFLYGDAGDDLYVMGKGDGKDYISNNDAAGHDTLLLEGVSESQVWLQKSGNDLLASIIGTSAGASITSWYLNASSQVDDIKVGTTGKVLSASKVDALVQAMSSLTPPTAGQTTLPQAYQDKLNSVIAASWV